MYLKNQPAKNNKNKIYQPVSNFTQLKTIIHIRIIMFANMCFNLNKE